MCDASRTKSQTALQSNQPMRAPEMQAPDTSFAAAELKTLWRDPDFTPGENAAYYIRVLENPTCRWSTWDAVRNGTPPNPDIEPTLQERAWTSPVFVKEG